MPQPPENSGQMVNRIVNIKPLQQQTATMLTGHMSRQVTLYPDTQRAIYQPGERFTITLNAIDVDYISFEDSVLWAKVETSSKGNIEYVEEAGITITGGKETWSGMHTRFKYPALGGASYIDRFRIFAGTTEIQDYERYWGLWGTLAEMNAPRGFESYETMLMNSRCSPAVIKMMRSDGDYRHELNATHTCYAAPHTTANTIITCKYTHWVQIPLLSVFNDAGWIPNYQMGNKIKLEFVLVPNNLPYASSFWSGSGGDDVTPEIKDGAAPCTPIYYDSRPMRWSECVPDVCYAYGCTAATAGVVVTPVGTVGKIWKVDESHFSWRFTDIMLRVNGLTVLQGGQLDAQPVEIFTKSYVTMTAPTTGQRDERIAFQIKKSSIRKMHMIFTDPSIYSTQKWQDCTIEHWLRAGTMGAIKYEPLDPNYDAEHKVYDPSITWFAVELGGKRYPTDFGTGPERHPDDRDANTHEMFRAYNRFMGRNDVSGMLFPASLTAFDETCHGSMPSQRFERYPGFNNCFELTYTSDLNCGYLGQVDGCLEIKNGTQAHPAWYGMTKSLYGGPAIRTGYKPQKSVFSNVLADVRPFSQYHRLHATCGLTGGKFIMAVTMGAMDKASTLIQGVDTERYDFNVLFSRNEAINTTKYKMAAWEESDPAGENEFQWPAARMTERIPEITVFFDYDVKLTIQNGVIILDD